MAQTNTGMAVSAAGQEAHDQRVVEQFTRWAQPFADLPIHAEAAAMARTLNACGLSADDDVLDVACGPGILACAMAGRVRHATGIDLTPAMIAQARMRQEKAGLTNMDWHVGHAAALPFDSAAFDCVTTRYSFHHIPDPAAVLAEMRRVCRPGGRVVAIDATPAPDKQAAYDTMERLRDPSHASALTLHRLREIGARLGLTELLVDGYRLEARLETLADPGDMAALTVMFEEDIRSGEDRIGVSPRRAADGIRFIFPISIVAWRV